MLVVRLSFCGEDRARKAYCKDYSGDAAVPKVDAGHLPDATNVDSRPNKQEFSDEDSEQTKDEEMMTARKG